MNDVIIKKVENKEEAIKCNELLTKLINDETKYDSNLKENIIVDNWFQNLYDKDNNAIFIAKIEDKIVGYIYVKILQDETKIEKESFINGLYVLEEYRNNKIATKLKKEKKKWSIENESKYISLNVLSKNEVAIHLYKKLNFNEFSVRLKTEL